MISGSLVDVCCQGAQVLTEPRQGRGQVVLGTGKTDGGVEVATVYAKAIEDAFSANQAQFVLQIAVRGEFGHSAARVGEAAQVDGDDDVTIWVRTSAGAAQGQNQTELGEHFLLVIEARLELHRLETEPAKGAPVVFSRKGDEAAALCHLIEHHELFALCVIDIVSNLNAIAACQRERE